MPSLKQLERRSSVGGPARWFLEKNCGTVHYTVCEVLGNEIPGTVYDLLWGARGLRYLLLPHRWTKSAAKSRRFCSRRRRGEQRAMPE